jgi:hypothetical protein
MGSLKSQVFNVNITPQGQLGGRFDSDTPQQFSAVFINNGAGADYVNQFPMMGIWGKSLASGAHTADLCWGSAGGYDLYSDATIPAVIVVFYPG